MFDANPQAPTMTTRRGFDISDIQQGKHIIRITNGVYIPGVLKNRWRASSEMEKHSASRKTPFTRAARISALCHPYEYRESDEFSAVSYKEQ